MRKTLLLLFLLLSGISITYAQTREITGKVTDIKGGAPLIGVSIKIKGGKAETVTAPDGSFKISVSSSARYLVFSYVGYEDNEVEITGTNLLVSMAQSEKSLSDVMVVGYGTRVKRDVTGSIAKVGGKDITNTPATSFESAIQGRAAGVFVQQQNGKLGQAINIRIRGASSLTAGTEPLYVVDGIPITGGSNGDLSSNGASTNALADLNMNDIESIQILKDASSSAMYGSQGSNGVVLITTKKGRAGQSKVEVNYYTGDQTPTGKREFLNAKEWVNYFERAGEGAAKVEYDLGYYGSLNSAKADWKDYVESRFTRYAAGTDSWKNGKINTDWQNQAFQRAPISQYDVNISGGTEKTKIFISGQYLDQTGILVSNKYQRYSGRLNIDHQVKTWLNVGVNMSYARSKNFRVSNDDQFSTPLQIVALSPITPPIDPRTKMISGAFDTDPNNYGAPNSNYPLYYNPMLNVADAFYHTTVNRTIGDAYANITISKAFTFRSEFGLDQLNQLEEGYSGKLTARNSGVPNGSGFYYPTYVLAYTNNNYLNFKKGFKGGHNVDAVVGLSYQETATTWGGAGAEQFPSDSYKKLSSGASKTIAISDAYSNTLLSYFARANYKFNDKYLLALSGRVDGSSVFGTNNRYGFFPAASVGWIMSDENFMNGVKWLSFLKLKASYGATGNDKISPYAARGLYSGSGAYGGLAGQIPSQLANPDLKWETTIGTDFGFEAGIFNNRINIEMAYYVKKTKDLLLSVDVPGTSGFASQTRNVGNMQNKGIEITINTTNIQGRYFNWTTSLNFSANRNKVTNLGGQLLGDDVNKAKEGEPLGVFIAREFAGADPQTGDGLYYKNASKGDRSTTNDYNQANDVVIGNPNPKFIYGMGNTFSYMGVNLDILLQGVYGNNIYNGGGVYMSAEGSNGFDNQSRDQLGYWNKPGDKSMVPEPRLFYPNGIDPSSRWIEDGSYLRVKAVTLGYDLPADIINKWKIQSFRVYVRAQNLFTFTKYKGWDPEVNADYQATNINQGQDFYSAPQIKTIAIGVSIGL